MAASERLYFVAKEWILLSVDKFLYFIFHFVLFELLSSMLPILNHITKCLQTGFLYNITQQNFRKTHQITKPAKSA